MLNYLEAFWLALVACAATNVDNILLALATGDRLRAGRFAATFFGVLALVVLLALALSQGADLVMPRFINWIGLIPFGLGVLEFRHRRIRVSNQPGEHAPLLGAAAVLAANSLDTLLVQTILFSDTASPYELATLGGSMTAAVLLAGLALLLLTRPRLADRLIPPAARARPWILMAVGLLIFLDTGFDTQ